LKNKKVKKSEDESPKSEDFSYRLRTSDF